jgi:hypothetical protein
MDSPIYLWLDDIREPRGGYNATHCVKTALEAVVLLATGRVIRASLDHDVNVTPDARGHPLRNVPQTGLDLVVWMRETGHWPRDGVAVHSCNPIQAPEMRRLIQEHYS